MHRRTSSRNAGGGRFAGFVLRDVLGVIAGCARRGLRHARWLIAGAKAPPRKGEDDGLVGRYRPDEGTPWSSPGMRFPEEASSVRMAIICDAFTTLQLSMEVPVCVLRPSDWREQMEEFAPHLLFVESAWQGGNGEWAGQIAGNGTALRELIDYCRGRGIPTIFWAKEDPVHYEDFIETASAFDFVFTTDSDCIPCYQRDLAHGRVYLFPFAVQPRLHHPIAGPGEERIAGSFFAGAWYEGFRQRCDDFTQLADALASAGPLDIYDRLSTDGRSSYPAHYDAHVRQGVPYTETPVLYRSYRIGMTINTVTDSPTMFARRAVELMACGTSVYSNRCRALEYLFGNLVKCFDSAGDASEAARRELALVPDPTERRRRTAAIRKVVREFSWSARIRWMIATVSGQPYSPARPELAVLARVNDQRQLETVRQMAAAQRGVQATLYIVADRDDLVAGDAVWLTEQMRESSLRDLLGEKAWVAPWHPDDVYGPHYLAELVDGLSFGLAPAASQDRRVAGTGPAGETGGDQGFRLVASSELRSSLFRADAWAGTVQTLLECLESGRLDLPAIVSMDADSYIRNGGVSGGRVAEPSFATQGVSLDELLGAPAAGTAAPPVHSRINPETLAGYFEGCEVPAGASIALKRKRLEVVGLQASAREAEIISEPLPRHLLEREGRLRISLVPGPQVVERIRLDAIDRWGKILHSFDVGKTAWSSGVAVDGCVAAYRMVIRPRKWSVEYFDGFVMDAID